MQSPGLSSAKWWIGGLGRTADSAIVMAQLWTPEGKDGKLVWQGPHAFFVPIRDRQTRETLPVSMRFAIVFYVQGMTMVNTNSFILNLIRDELLWTLDQRLVTQ